MADDPELGRLSETQNERIFRTEILPDYLPTDIGKADHPTLVVIGGQPGSGTTALLESGHADLEQSGPVIRITSGDLAAYHPDFITHQATGPGTASRFAQTDAGVWTEKLLAAATTRGVHVIVETTMQAPETVERIVTDGRDANYRVEVHVLAVNPRVSWQGGHYRFEELNHAGAAAPVPVRSEHENSVVGLAESLKRIERGSLADRVVVQTASGAKIYDNELEQGQWRSAPAARQVLEETRGRPLSGEEIDRFAAGWEKVLSRMHERGAPMDRIDEATRQSRDDLAWFIAERRRADADDSRDTQEIAHRLERGFAPAIPAPTVDASIPTPGDRARERTGESQDRHVHPGDILIPGRELPDLGEAEIDRGLRESSRLAGKRAEVDRLFQLVYGNSGAVSGTVEGIDGAMAGSAAGQDVRAGKLGPMAGEGRGFLRGESPERQTARAHLPQLAAALEDYGRTVDFERHQIETRHREEQHRHRQAIRAPSEGLSQVLRAPAHEQASRLNASSQTRRELEQIVAAINRRLGPDDRRALRAHDTGQLARSLGTSQDRAIALTRLHAQTQAVGRQVQMQRQQLDRNAGLTIKR
ncbi:zeta toxin family protein [Agrobacterium tumefaciens]|uniref:zeta toxin family protein n=1 Tax=Agrobacterium tumefaciens TaxID=358 RepID=UPI002243A17D|nr:zeta toxin family protein [Agrobacterium tumefaciens]MCW8060472.1 zeta toxin family protein [Agrobacterium tumefaciens]MCW8145916.1 zeta toxin family protein [Agrobacterium tumefaciens]